MQANQAGDWKREKKKGMAKTYQRRKGEKKTWGAI